MTKPKRPTRKPTMKAKPEPMSPYHRAQQAFARQRQVLELALAGQRQTEIGEVVGMSQRGVGKMLKRLRQEGLFDPDAAQLTARQVAAAVALDVPAPLAEKRRRAPGAGRPPAGEGGRMVRDLPTVSTTMTLGTVATLRALSVVRGVGMWRLMELGVSLIPITKEEGQLAEGLAERELSRLRLKHPKAW